MTRLKIPIVILLALALSTVGCGSLNVLQAVVDSTAAAVPILQAAGVPIPPEVPAYIAAVANCIASQTGTPTPVQLAAISGCLAKQIAPTLPPGIPQAIANVVALVAQDIVRYLQANPAPVVGSTTARGSTRATLSAGDVAQINAMREKAKATVAALKAPPKK